LLLSSDLYLLYRIRSHLRSFFCPAIPPEEIKKPFKRGKWRLQPQAWFPQLALDFLGLGSIVLGWSALRKRRLWAPSGVSMTSAYRNLAQGREGNGHLNVENVDMIMMILTGRSRCSECFPWEWAGVRLLKKYFSALHLGPGVFWSFSSLSFNWPDSVLRWASILLVFVPFFLRIIDKLGFDRFGLAPSSS